MTEDERLDGITDSKGHEFEQALEDSEGQRCLACCDSESQRVEQD